MTPQPNTRPPRPPSPSPDPPFPPPPPPTPPYPLPLPSTPPPPLFQPDAPPLSSDATIRTAIGALAAVLGEDLKASEIEVGVVRAGVADGAFQVLAAAEVDDHLVALSERD